MANKPRLILTRKLPGQTETRLSELFEVTRNESDRRFSRAALLQAAGNCDVLCPTLASRSPLANAGILDA